MKRVFEPGWEIACTKEISIKVDRRGQNIGFYHGIFIPPDKLTEILQGRIAIFIKNGPKGRFVYSTTHDLPFSWVLEPDDLSVLQYYVEAEGKLPPYGTDLFRIYREIPAKEQSKIFLIAFHACNRRNWTGKTFTQILQMEGKSEWDEAEVRVGFCNNILESGIDTENLEGFLAFHQTAIAEVEQQRIHQEEIRIKHSSPEYLEKERIRKAEQARRESLEQDNYPVTFGYSHGEGDW